MEGKLSARFENTNAATTETTSAITIAHHMPLTPHINGSV